MDTKKMDRMVSAIICSSSGHRQARQVVKALTWNEGETLEQAQQRQREKSERIKAKLAAQRGA
jgi:hypothetical protein